MDDTVYDLIYGINSSNDNDNGNGNDNDNDNYNDNDNNHYGNDNNHYGNDNNPYNNSYNEYRFPLEISELPSLLTPVENIEHIIKRHGQDPTDDRVTNFMRTQVRNLYKTSTQEDCPVCLEKITHENLEILWCGHFYCVECTLNIDECPVCKIAISRGYQIVRSNQNYATLFT